MSALTMTTDERAKAFAHRTLAGVKDGTIKRETQPNRGDAFSVERDAKLVEDHKRMLDTSLWNDFLANSQ